jgi:hypothetical protein
MGAGHRAAPVPHARGIAGTPFGRPRVAFHGAARDARTAHTVPMRSGARVLVAVAAAVTAGAMLTGCSPDNWPTIAVVFIDGQPAAVAAPCPADQLTLLQLSEVHGGDASGWPQWQSQGDRPLRDGETVKLLQDPDGWRTTRSEVIEISPDRTYSVQAVGKQVSFSVEFTLSDLQKLDSDQVWTSTDGTTNRTVPRPEFQRDANSDCTR